MSILMIGQKSKMFQAIPGNRKYLNPYRTPKQKAQIRNYKQSRQEQYRNQLLQQINEKQHKKNEQRKRLVQLELKHQMQFYQKIKKQQNRNKQKDNQKLSAGRLPTISNSNQYLEQSPNYHNRSNYNNIETMDMQLQSQSQQPSFQQRGHHSRDRYKTQFSSYKNNDYNGFNYQNPEEDYSSVYHYESLIDPILLNNDYDERKKELKNSLDRKSHQIYDLLMYSKNLVKKDFRSQSIRITKRLKTQNFYRDLSLIEQNQKLVRQKGGYDKGQVPHLRNLSNFQNYEYQLINNSSSQSRISRFYKLPKIFKKRSRHVETHPFVSAYEQDYQDEQ